MISYELFCERAFSPAGQAAREKMRAQAGLNAARKAAQAATPKALPGKGPQKALPAAGGALAKVKPSSMVKSPPKPKPLTKTSSGSMVKKPGGSLVSNKPDATTPATVAQKQAKKISPKVSPKKSGKKDKKSGLGKYFKNADSKDPGVSSVELQGADTSVGGRSSK